MRIRFFLLGLCCTGALAAQTTFVVMADPQFGFFEANKSFAHETANFEFAIAAADRIHPAFIVVAGDLVNKAGDAAQIAEFKRIARRLAPGIKLFSLPGNHDVSDPVTPESVEAYRKAFGPDYYSFQAGDVTGIVLNSALQKDSSKAPGREAKMEAWLRDELAKARRAGAKRIIVFQHHPLFLEKPDEPDQYFNIPLEVRRKYLRLFHENGVELVFAGHLHRNSEGRDGDLEMVTTGPVGKPLGGAKSGFRIVKVAPEGVTHKYYDFGDLP